MTESTIVTTRAGRLSGQEAPMTLQITKDSIDIGIVTRDSGPMV